MGKARGFTFGIDTAANYGPDYVLSALGSLTPEAGYGKSVLRVLFLPSFYPECLLTVIDHGGTGIIELVSAQTNLWFYGCHARRKATGRLDPDEPVPPEPNRWVESAAMLPLEMERLRLETQVFLRSQPKDTPTDGCEGMTVRVEYWEVHRKPLIASAWSPSPDRAPEFHRLMFAVHREASSRLKGESSRRLLEKLFGHIGPGLADKELAKAPSVVRLFGNFSSYDLKEVDAFFAKLPSYQPLVLDLSTFDGMGTILHSLFARVVNRPGKTVWWASSYAEKHLRKIGVPRECIASTRAEALRKLAELK